LKGFIFTSYKNKKPHHAHQITHTIPIPLLLLLLFAGVGGAESAG
jgi:hypothetical protein